MKNDKKQDENKETIIEETSSTSQENNHKKCQENIEELQNKYKRALADYQNLEKRITQERSDWVKASGRGIVLKLLPVLDTLELAQKHVEDKGLQLAIQQFLDVLKQEGVEKIETVGKDFDPHRMECVQTVDGEDGKVIEEFRSGYTLYDKVLRPSQVSVGKGKN